jgi:hypothetical protein
MEGKWRKAIAVGAMALAGGVLFAESNRSSSTAGIFGTEVDDFLAPMWFGSVLGGDEPKSFFAYTRLGRGTVNGELELGAATKFGESLYIAAFYKGWFQFDGGNSVKGQEHTLKDGADKTLKEITLYTEERSGKPFTIGALVGLGSLGIKASYDDNLKIEGNGVSGGVKNTYDGSIKPSVGVGGLTVGPLHEVRLSVDFMRDETITQSVSGSRLAHYGNSIASKNPSSRAAFQQAVTGGTMGSYVEPELYINLGFGPNPGLGFSLENSLAVRLFTNSAADKSDGQAHDSDVSGLAWWTTSYDAETSTNSTIDAIWDNKFHLSDTITPGYAVEGKLADDKVNWKVSAQAPVTLTVGSDAFSAKSEGGSTSVLT